MSFFRHREIYPSDGGAGFAANAPAHRLDEFPASYSSASCSPAELASASLACSSVKSDRRNGKKFSANGNLSLISVSHRRGSLQATKSPNRFLRKRVQRFSSAYLRISKPVPEMDSILTIAAQKQRFRAACPQLGSSTTGFFHGPSRSRLRKQRFRAACPQLGSTHRRLDEK